MKLTPSDPDIKTIMGRIFDKELILQPDFQRGEVWPDSKKKRLIDSILRNWYVPPIHIIELENYSSEVLDGQQRLVSLRDFVNDQLKIDGNIEPIDAYIRNLDGLKYSELDDSLRRKFENFTIRFIKVTDYKPEEPGELFFRLNQPTNLTAAEQRNAYFGPARDQVKKIVMEFENLGFNFDNLGFSNSRMAYDDVISKFCYTLMLGTLQIKITSNDIANLYRSQNEFPGRVLNKVCDTLVLFSKSIKYFQYKCKFNKATLFGWLCFIVKFKDYFNDKIDYVVIGEFISYFEENRNFLKTKSKLDSNIIVSDMFLNSSDNLKTLFLIFNQKASASSTDVSAILSRDLILWIMFYYYINERKIDKYIDDNLSQIYFELFDNKDIIRGLDDIIYKYKWGSQI